MWLSHRIDAVEIGCKFYFDVIITCNSHSLSNFSGVDLLCFFPVYFVADFVLSKHSHTYLICIQP